MSKLGKISKKIAKTAVKGGKALVRDFLDDFFDNFYSDTKGYSSQKKMREEKEKKKNLKETEKPYVELPLRKRPNSFGKDTLSSIDDNTKEILEVFGKFSKQELKRQNDLIKKSEDLEQKHAEQNLEKPYEDKENLTPNVQVVDNSKPFVEALDKLISKINSLDFSNFGYGSSGTNVNGHMIGGKAKGKKFQKVSMKNGKTAWRDTKTGRFVSEATVKAERKEITKAIIKKTAKPLVVRGLGKTVFKSIPIIGTGIAAGFALSRIMEGDYVGAGLEMTSGLAGPILAIPSFISSIVRDVYSSTYGIYPEEDPEASSRFKLVYNSIKELVSEQLKPNLVSKQQKEESSFFSPFVGSAHAATTQPNKVVQNPVKPSKPVSSQPPLYKPKKTKENNKSTSSSPNGTGDSTKAVDPIDIKQGSEQATQTSNVPNASDAIQNNDVDTSRKLEKATNEYNSSLEAPNDNLDMSLPPTIPEDLPMINNGSSADNGDDVPDPNYYDMGDIVKQMYFSFSVV